MTAMLLRVILGFAKNQEHIDNVCKYFSERSSIKLLLSTGNLIIDRCDLAIYFHG